MPEEGLRFFRGKRKRKVKSMKKIFLTMVAMLSMSMAYAETENVNSDNNMKAYDMSVNYTKLAICLGLDLDQMEVVENIHETFCEEMLNAASDTKDDKNERLSSAVKRDLQYMRYVLDDKQYNKYQTLLSITFNNRGLKDLATVNK
jgi:hypothetical protein